MKQVLEFQSTIQERQIFKEYCLRNDLATYDPYDIWKTGIGAIVKRKFYGGGYVIRGIAGLFSFIDIFLNNRFRLGYKKQEYAIVRALAAQILDKKFQITGEKEYLTYANQNIEWLLKNYIKSNHGIGWGIDFELPVTQNVIYPKATPFATITPYVLETLILHEYVTDQKGKYQDICKSIYNFFEKDIQVLEQNATSEATSYSPYRDRKVVNAVSYTMYSLVLLDKYFNSHQNSLQRITRLYNYIKKQQRNDGSWYYSEEGESFIDCFHSCIVIKNLIKSRNQGLKCEGIDDVINKGYRYIKSYLWDKRKKMYKRFSVSNKPGFINYDLYDNAEMLQCAVLMGDINEAKKIASSIKKNFIYNDNIYSSIDIFGKKRNSNMLRWAIMPYLYSLNLLEMYEEKS